MSFLDGAGLAYFWTKVHAALADKQNVLSGTAGQIVGFDANGDASAVDAQFVTSQQLTAAIAAAVTGATEGYY